MRVIFACLFLMLCLPAGSQSRMSAKQAEALIDAKITAKEAKIDEIDGITLRLKEATVFLTYNNCEDAWKWKTVFIFRSPFNGDRYAVRIRRHILQHDPCKAELQRIALTLGATQ